MTNSSIEYHTQGPRKQLCDGNIIYPKGKLNATCPAYWAPVSPLSKLPMLQEPPRPLLPNDQPSFFINNFHPFLVFRCRLRSYTDVKERWRQRTTAGGKKITGLAQYFLIGSFSKVEGKLRKLEQISFKPV